jgi:Reverse transcriptase (RNA-dependent DNA polymerase)
MIRSPDLSVMNAWMDDHTDPEHDTIEEWHPFAFASQVNASDNPTWEEAMNGPDKSGYWKACEKEIQTLENKECWDIIDKENWMNVLPGTWAFRCKRFPDGLVRKLKARFCARGDRQIEGLDFFETFAPVTNWMTVRLMLTLSMIFGLYTKQVDYTAAFIHAPIDGDVFVEMPRGFSQKGKCLKLKKSIYGLRQSPRNFFQHLKGKLKNAGLVSNPELDPCLFVSDKVICLVYVDDTLFFSPMEQYIDEVIQRLRDDDMELEEESSVAGFLGVNMTYNKENDTVKLTQEGLTKRIIEALNIEHLPRKHTPATHEPLVKDEDGDPPDGVYSYSSVIGMMQYLQGHSRPDITYAVSQCARFTHSPKRSHERALERIGQYLKGTIPEGLIMKPSQNLDLDCYVDADFAGLWPYEDKLDPVCVKSRTGFVLCIADCPIIWLSKLQDAIALSTQEAEYYALSFCMRSVLPLQRLFKATASGLGITKEQATTFKTSVWEDNQGAHNLANMEPGRTTPRSKHYAIKYHWFRSHLKPNQVEVKKIDTNAQKADILTKGLRTDKFRDIRKLLCGW